MPVMKWDTIYLDVVSLRCHHPVLNPDHIRIIYALTWDDTKDENCDQKIALLDKGIQFIQPFRNGRIPNPAVLNASGASTWQYLVDGELPGGGQEIFVADLTPGQTLYGIVKVIAANFYPGNGEGNPIGTAHFRVYNDPDEAAPLPPWPMFETVDIPRKYLSDGAVPGNPPKWGRPDVNSPTPPWGYNLVLTGQGANYDLCLQFRIENRH